MFTSSPASSLGFSPPLLGVMVSARCRHWGVLSVFMWVCAHVVQNILNPKTSENYFLYLNLTS